MMSSSDFTRKSSISLISFGFGIRLKFLEKILIELCEAALVKQLNQHTGRRIIRIWLKPHCSTLPGRIRAWSHMNYGLRINFRSLGCKIGNIKFHHSYPVALQYFVFFVVVVVLLYTSVFWISSLFSISYRIIYFCKQTTML